MTIQYYPDGDAWFESKSKLVNISCVVKRILQGANIDEIRDELKIKNKDWKPFIESVKTVSRDMYPFPNNADDMMTQVNLKLVNYALAIPPLITEGELNEIATLLNSSEVDVGKIEDNIFGIVMDIRVRTVQLVGRFRELDPFKEFAYLIDSAALAYYSNNITCAFLTMLPVIEGILLRWQGYPQNNTPKPTFKQTIQFLENTTTRQPVPIGMKFVDSHVATLKKIMEEHLYKNTTAGPSIDNFNRHLALHMLDDKEFCTSKNVGRAFLLLDMLSDIYIGEKHLDDPRSNLTPNQELLTAFAYSNAVLQSFLPTAPEHYLTKVYPALEQYRYIDVDKCLNTITGYMYRLSKS